MFPHHHGNPHNVCPSEEFPHSNQHQHNMMQDLHARDHHRPEYHSSSFPYPPPPRPPFQPYDNPCCPDGPSHPFPPPHSYAPSFPSLYPPQPTSESFYPPPPPPPHTAPYAPRFAPPHVSSFGEHSNLSSEHTAARPAFEVAHHRSSFPHHASSFQENKPWMLEGGSVALLEPSPSPSIVHRSVDVELPKGQVVRVFCKSNRNYNLAVKDDRLMMVEADSGNESQQWIRDDKYSIRVRDSSGQPAFMLINKASKKALKHAKGKLQEVQLIDYPPDMQDDLFWTESQDFGEGFKTLRMASDTLLNLTAGHGDKVEDGSSIMLDTWHKHNNQLWKIFPL